MRPWLWLLAGPNGSGKSTLAQTEAFDLLVATPEHAVKLTRLNADAEARRLRDQTPDLDPDEAALEAAKRTDARLDDLIEARRPVLVETVLSSDKYIARCQRARKLGFGVGLVFVFLADPELNVDRVAQRVALGGHDVPADRIRARWARSLERLPVFARLADTIHVFENSEIASPKLLIDATPQSYFIDQAARQIIVSNPQGAVAAALSTLISDLESAS